MKTDKVNAGTPASLHAHLIPKCPQADLFNKRGRDWLPRQPVPEDDECRAAQKVEPIIKTQYPSDGPRRRNTSILRSMDQRTPTQEIGHSSTGRAAELLRQMWIRSTDHYPGPQLLDALQDDARQTIAIDQTPIATRTACTTGGNHRSRE